MIVSTVAAQRRALFVLALTVVLGASRFVTESWAAGAFAVGKCGAYGQAFDYPAEASARAAALKQCKGDCIGRRHGQSLRCPRLCRETQDLQLAQRRHPQMLRIRGQGMRHPRLGLRRQGVTLAVIPGLAKREPQMRNRASGKFEIPGLVLRTIPE